MRASWRALVVIAAGAVVAVMLVLLAPASTAAAAALRFSTCSFSSNGSCATVSVPLDRSGAVPGAVTLEVERFRTARTSNPGVLLAIAGGPGQSGIAAFEEPYVDALGPALRTRDLVTLDLRGTGRSGALRCPAFERANLDHAPQAGADCAARIGPRRAFYTTRDAADDIEAVRAAIGVDHIAIYGISYGSQVAQVYAARYPVHVERMLLDAIVPPGGPDPLYRETLAAIPRSLRALCRGGGCRGVTADPAADLAALSRRIGRGVLRGSIVDTHGRRGHAAINREDLLQLLLSGDIVPWVRASLPAAIRSALAGDPAALLRLAASTGGGVRQAAAAPAETRALFAATICEESPFPWDRGTAIGDRPAQAQARVDALPASSFAPFDGATALAGEYVRTCLGWPETPAAPPPPGAPSGAPTLLLNGENDLRTPLESAQHLAASMPAATLVAVPATGHGSLVGRLRCVKLAVAEFFAPGPVTSRCAFGAPPAALRPLPLAPRSLSAVRPPRGSSGRPGRTLAAVLLTLADARAQVQGLQPPPGARLGGLRGGTLRLNEGSAILNQLDLVLAVQITGRLTDGGGRLHIGGGAAAAGTLAVDRHGDVRGVLGRRAVHAHLPSGELGALVQG